MSQKQNVRAGTVNSSIFIDYPAPGGSRVVPCGAAHATIAMAVTCPVQLNLEMYPVYTTGTVKKTNIYDVPTAIKNIRILGLMAVISYMMVILSVWMYANAGGYVYFLAGEPNLLIKYIEWVLGFTGILVATDFLHKEIKEMVVR